MSKQIKSYKFRLYPTKVQEIELVKVFGYRRFVYNKILSLIEENHDLGLKFPTKFDLFNAVKPLRKSFPFLKDGSANSYQVSITDLYETYQKFFSKKGKKPKFKSKKGKNTVTYSQGIKLENNKLTVEKIHNIPICLDKRFKNKFINNLKPLQVTITKVHSGKYFASIIYNLGELPKLLTPVGVIGQDQGIKSLIVNSNNKVIEPRKPLKKYTKKLKRLQRSFARKKKGSKNRNKQRIKVAKLHEKITNIRKFQLDLTATNSVLKAKRDNQALAIQKINVENQLKNHKLARSIADAGMGYYFKRLQQKSLEHGVPLLIIDNWTATSKLCSNCWAKNSKLTLNDRIWTCPHCGATHYRDHNAAKVCKIIGEVYLNLRPNTVGSTEIKACYKDGGLTVSLDETPKVMVDLVENTEPIRETGKFQEITKCCSLEIKNDRLSMKQEAYSFNKEGAVNSNVNEKMLL